jgi:AcrR family transcriptional regulator
MMGTSCLPTSPPWEPADVSAKAVAVTSPRRRARRGEGDRLRAEILTAAERLLIERGSDEAVSIRAIADAVGVTPPSIYMHFADKEELFVALCDARFEELDRLSEEAGAAATDPLDEIRRRGEAYIRFGLENPEQYRILFMDPQLATAGPADVEKWACLQHMVEAVQRAIGAGVIVGDDPFLVTVGLWAAVHGLVSLMITKPGMPWPPRETLIDQVLVGAVAGLLPT